MKKFNVTITLLLCSILSFSYKSATAAGQQDKDYAKLIFGEWRSEQDDKMKLVFKNGTVEDINGHDETKEISRYEISRTSCEDGDEPENSGKHVYLKMISEDTGELCYIIDNLDNNTLTLMYVGGNGSISVYKRAGK